MIIDNSKKEKKILGYEELYQKLILLYKNKNLPKKFIISGPKSMGKAIFATYFINYILKPDFLINDQSFVYDDFSKSTLSLDKNINQNFFHISLKDGKKNVEIEQIRNLINFSQKKSFNNKPRFVLIDDLEKFNLNASNSLLKLLEEPNNNLYLLLIHDNKSKILETISSRCISFNVNFAFDKTLSIVNEILNINIYDYLNKSIVSNYSTIGDLIDLYYFSLNNKIDLKNISLYEFTNFLIEDKKYKTDNKILYLSIKIIESYFYESFVLSKNMKFYNYYTYFSYKFFNAIKFNLDFESLFLEVKRKVSNE